MLYSRSKLNSVLSSGDLPAKRETGEGPVRSRHCKRVAMMMQKHPLGNREGNQSEDT